MNQIPSAHVKIIAMRILQVVFISLLVAIVSAHCAGSGNPVPTNLFTPTMTPSSTATWIPTPDALEVEILLTPTGPFSTATLGVQESSQVSATRQPIISRTPTPSPTPIPFAALKALPPGIYPMFWSLDTHYLSISFVDDGQSIPLAALPWMYFSLEYVVTSDQTRMIVLENETAILRLWIYDLTTGNRSELVPQLQTPGESLFEIHNLNISPDGEWLLYSAKYNTNGKGRGHNQKIYLTSIASGQTYTLIDWEACFSAYPEWSDDGKWIAFGSDCWISDPDYTSYWASPAMDLYVMDAGCIAQPDSCSATARRVVVWKEGSFYSQEWEGNLIVYRCGNAVCRIDPATGGNVQVNPLSPPGTSRWKKSSDGDWRAYLQNGDIFIMPASGGEAQNLIDVPEDNIRDYFWSPDGEYIAFEWEKLDTSTKFHFSEIAVVRIDGGPLINLTNTNEQTEYFAGWWIVRGPFRAGDAHVISAAGDNLNLRAGPSLSDTVLAKLHTGARITLLEGPVEADGYNWWKMRTEDGLEGWAVEVAEWYIPAVYPSIPPALVPMATPARTPTATPAPGR